MAYKIIRLLVICSFYNHSKPLKLSDTIDIGEPKRIREDLGYIQRINIEDQPRFNLSGLISELVTSKKDRRHKLSYYNSKENEADEEIVKDKAINNGESIKESVERDALSMKVKDDQNNDDGDDDKSSEEPVLRQGDDREADEELLYDFDKPDLRISWR